MWQYLPSLPQAATAGAPYFSQQPFARLQLMAMLWLMDVRPRDK